MSKDKTNKGAPKSKVKKDYSGLQRALYIIAFAAMLSIGAYFFVMVNQPDTSQKVLGVFAILSSMYYFVRAISTK